MGFLAWLLRWLFPPPPTPPKPALCGCAPGACAKGGDPPPKVVCEVLPGFNPPVVVFRTEGRA